MNESILTSIKKLLGIIETDESFDTDIAMHINTAFGILKQLGVGPAAGYSITDKHDLWSDFMDEENVIEPVKSYVFIRVRLMFDPPANSTIVEAMRETIKELEWRINVEVENASN